MPELTSQRLDHAPLEVGQVVSAHADAESDVHAMGKPPVGNRPVAVIPRLPMLACQWSLEISGRSMPNRKIGRARYVHERLDGTAMEGR